MIENAEQIGGNQYISGALRYLKALQEEEALDQNSFNEVIASFDYATPEALLAARANSSNLEILCFGFCVAVENELPLQKALISLGLSRDGSVTVGVLDQLFGAWTRGASLVGPGSHLALAHLINVSDTGPFASRSINVCPSVMWALAGDKNLDTALPFGSELISDPDESGDLTSLLVLGEDKQARRTKSIECLDHNLFLYVRNPANLDQWKSAVREATIAGAALVIDLSEEFSAQGLRLAADATHLMLAVCSKSPIDIDLLSSERGWLEINASETKFSIEEQTAEFGQATMYPLTQDHAHKVRKGLPLVANDLNRAVRRLADNRLSTLGTRATPIKSWNDLIVSEETLRDLKELSNRYRYWDQVMSQSHVGRFMAPGALAVLAGPSGSGKTLAAEVIANDLKLDLVKINLSTLVSKYIGETEKNLEEVFDATSVGGALILFDEGDAIFGQRGKVTDARDRYANMEVSYLLQKVETFEGFVIITTNLSGNVDTAFQRRLQGFIEISAPDGDARHKIWDLHISKSECENDVNLTELATFDLTGGQIRNIAVGASFLAIQEGRKICRTDLFRATKQEFVKHGRLTKELNI